MCLVVDASQTLPVELHEASNQDIDMFHLACGLCVDLHLLCIECSMSRLQKPMLWGAARMLE